MDMIKYLLISFTFLFVCSDCSSSDGGNCSIDGTYIVKYVQNPNVASTCSGGISGTDTYTIVTTNGSASISIGSFQGSCENNQVNGCSAIVNCIINGSTGSITIQGTLDFGGSGFTGAETIAISATSETCQYNEEATGTKE
jgi:hypothetical protein